MTATALARPPAAGASAARDIRPWYREHLPLFGALVLGVLARILVSLAFTPALMVSDSPSYLRFLETFAPNVSRPDGYGVLLLLPVTSVVDDVLAVALVQHVLGLATAVLLYALLRRWGVGRWLAAVAVLPVLLDAMQLLLEHTPLSDTTFVLLVVAGVTVLGWRRRPSLPLAVGAGLLLGASVVVRQVGMPLVVVGVLTCLLLAGSWRRGLLTALVLAITFAAPVAAYASWYHAERGVFALSDIGGKSAYMRTTTFVDCSLLDLPYYEQVLCPPEPVGERKDPTDYGWYEDGTVVHLVTPPGVTADEALRDFARRAVRAQPLDYAAVVLRDTALNFDWARVDRFEFNTAFKWRFSYYLTVAPSTWTDPGYLDHGGDLLSVHQPWADATVGYQRFVYLPGPLLLVCLVLGTLGTFGVGRARRSGLRTVCFLTTATGFGLVVAPAVSTEFIWRYQLPAVVLLPVAAALAVTALRGRGPTRGTDDVSAPAPSPRPAPTARTEG